ncbi:hypothetical protein LTR56_004775 [Elasticomyces elasticus]|nr:hypothetical protein LTR56_004775 [Elasticomyces elasticus]KAK3665631.1 hypothetical protein LTR22_003571 [Elasticomyces elasticus]KAK4930331.1 hypothetical protein LTR49_003072 [Elasticomyces elasticus]KAK5768942.1 hypothetical protein LTS12_001002 [Elasticomyces elasticus]
MDGPYPSDFQVPKSSSPIIHQLPTSVWWNIAGYLPTKDLSNLRLVSRRVDYELYQPYLKRKFTARAIDATATRDTKSTFQERDPEGVLAAVRSLALIDHLKHLPQVTSRCIACNTGRIPQAEKREHFRNGHTLIEIPTPPVLAAIAKGYAPLASIAAFANLHTLSVHGVSTEWLERCFPITDLANAMAKRSIKVKKLELQEINLDVEDITKLLAAFDGSLEKLSLRFESVQGEKRMVGKWVNLFRALEFLKLRALYFEVKLGIPKE